MVCRDLVPSVRITNWQKIFLGRQPKKLAFFHPSTGAYRSQFWDSHDLRAFAPLQSKKIIAYFWQSSRQHFDNICQNLPTLITVCQISAQLGLNFGLIFRNMVAVFAAKIHKYLMICLCVVFSNWFSSCFFREGDSLERKPRKWPKGTSSGDYSQYGGELTSGGSRAQMSMALAGGNVPKAKTQLITQI